MAYDGWFTLGGTEIANLARTVRLAGTLGISSVRIREESVGWIEDALDPLGADPYADITNAPWYDSEIPASAEFAGVIPLEVAGLADSSMEATTIEYVTDGGRSGQSRLATKTLVWKIVLVAKTEAGADYGERWLSHVLDKPLAYDPTCIGASLRYFSFAQQAGAPEPPVKHLNRVRLTRGISITRKRTRSCSVLLSATFTTVAGDPYEYGEPLTQLTSLGGVTPAGPGLATGGTEYLAQQSCPVFDFSPVYDPLYPALIAPPPPPNRLPAGWDMPPGRNFKRSWVRLLPVPPARSYFVPRVSLTTDTDARMVRVSIWADDGDGTEQEQCGALWSAIVSYLPSGDTFIIDGENQTAYVWDGANSRLANSLVYSPDAKPMLWDSINGLRNNDPATRGFYVTFDVFEVEPNSGTWEGGGTARASLEFVQRSG